MPGMKAKGKDVQSYVDAIETGKRALVEALRKFVRREAPQLLEQIKWGNICWIGKGNVCWIIVYKDHVDFGFFNGAKLKDPEGLLEGTGKGLRHVKVRESKDIRPKEFAALLKQALAMDG
ncbi:MAG TPA: DUF1801 domain-containing protein [Candidatus Thermoplasmatota archaeon]|nr:DUF1801 domain-containing protein [Candidatus Thermoplasmatota archaeon]